MRRLLLLSTVLASSLSLGVASAAQAMPDRAADPGGQRAQAKLTCPGGVVGVDGAKRVQSHFLTNNKVTASDRSRTKLPFRPTAWGLYDSQDTKAGSILSMNTVTTDGKPRRVTMTFKDGSKKIAVKSSKYDQDGFEPRLFADGYTFYAYTVDDAGKLERWTLTRFRNGDIRYVGKVAVGSGYDDLTSLQSSQVIKHNGPREYLYATTDAGALEQISVPVNNPKKEKRRTLLATGYAGVTELAWSYCNEDPTYVALWAIDPVAGTATWTTVRDAPANADTTLRGAVKGGGDWDFVTAY